MISEIPAPTTRNIVLSSNEVRILSEGNSRGWLGELTLLI